MPCLWIGNKILYFLNTTKYGELTDTELSTIRCWTSLQVIHGFTDKTRAITPAARGAAALVPECEAVQPVLSERCVTSVVTLLCNDIKMYVTILVILDM